MVHLVGEVVLDARADLQTYDVGFPVCRAQRPAQRPGEVDLRSQSVALKESRVAV